MVCEKLVCNILTAMALSGFIHETKQVMVVEHTGQSEITSSIWMRYPPPPPLNQGVQK